MKIAQFLQNSPWCDVTSAMLSKNAMGGRETAVIRLAEQWAKNGHEVIMFVPCSETYTDNYESGGYIKYVSPENVVGGTVTFAPDLFVTWEEPRIAGIKEVRSNSKLCFMGMQVAHIGNDEESNISLFSLDKTICLSEYAKNVLYNDHKDFIDLDDIVVIPNCVDIEKFPKERPTKSAIPTAIYSSSPDRGLQNLVYAWPLVVEKIPNAVLHVCYGVENWFKHSLYSNNRDGEHALEIMEFLGIDGNMIRHNENIKYHGKLPQHEVHKIMTEAQVLAYPCETQSPTETGCITVVEALASYTHPILGAADCLPEDYGSVSTMLDLPIDHVDYAEALINGLRGELPEQEAKIQYGRDLAETRDWSIAAKMYIDLAEGLLRK